MDVTLLRKLSRKSILKFGQYYDSTVQECLTFYRYKYLRWVYFNCSMITFMDDILEELKIPTDFRIEKPGVCKNKNEELNAILNSKMDGITRHIMHCRIKKEKRIKHSILEKNGSEYYTKDSLRRKNQGVYNK